jgi:regulatory protein
MSFQNARSKPRESDAMSQPRTARRAKPRLSLKMQAIGFLSRREHSRQELRAKLLDSLRKRAREDAMLEASASGSEQAVRELTDALTAQPSNGIDDAFAPVRPATIEPALAPARARVTRPPATPASPLAAAALPESESESESEPGRAPERTALDALAFADLELTDPEAAVDQLLDWLTAHDYLSESRFVESRVHARSRKQGTLRIKLELSRHGLALEPEQATALRETEFTRAQALWQRKFGELAPDARLRARQARFLAARGFAADVVRRVVGGEDEY